jgi:hypothetical protein
MNITSIVMSTLTREALDFVISLILSSSVAEAESPKSLIYDVPCYFYLLFFTYFKNELILELDLTLFKPAAS